MFKKYRNKISNLLKISKKNYYSTFFKKNLLNIRKTWQGIKEIINITSCIAKKQTIKLSIKNNLITDNELIANCFNDYFSNIADNLSKNIQPSKNNFNDFLNVSNINSFFLSPVTTEEIELFISSMDTKKSLGPNSIPASILKLSSNIISEPISIIVNNSFKCGIFPDFFKIANVVPIHKNGSKLELTNYRPISLLSNIGKIFEKMLHKRLYNFFDKFNCIHKRQFGFRKNHSTTHALIDFSETIRNALDNNKFVCGVFLDLQKAFDTVNHEILLTKLEFYGVRGIPLQWFKSYLKNRTQYVTINDIPSLTKPVRSGIPQGSILGPLLFLVYINELNSSIDNASTYHFADDTNLLVIEDSIEEMHAKTNEAIFSVVNWLRANKISLNTKKTKIIIFKTKYQNHLKKLGFNVDGEILPPSKTVKYLGVVFDENLSFKPHHTYLKTKLSRSIGMLAKIRHFVNFNTVNSIYHAIFSSHLRYACQIWGQTKNLTLNNLSSLQNKALKTIHFQNYLVGNVAILYKLSKTLKLMDDITFLNCVLVWDYLHGRLPQAFNNFFAQTSNKHSHFLRSSSCNNIFVEQFKTIKFGRNSIKYLCTFAWNNLPRRLKTENINSKPFFLNKLKTNFFESYS